MEKPIRLLAINASPKKNGTTVRLLQRFIKSAEIQKMSIERIGLYDEPIPFVSGQLGKKLKIPSWIQQKMIDCDGFVIATPTYWFNQPAILKNFIDHLTILEENNFMLDGKVAGLIVFSPEGGEFGVLSSLMLPLNHMGVVFPPYSALFYRGPQDAWIYNDIRLLAKLMKQQITAQRSMSFVWD